MRKSKTLPILAVILVITLTTTMFTACTDKAEPLVDPEPTDPVVEPGPDPTDPDANDAQIITLIEDIDTDDMFDMPLDIESVTLYDDGSVRVVPTGELLKNYEGSDALIDGGLYPFEYIDKVEEIYLVRFGNAGMRTVIALMSDGSLFAFSAQDLIQNHKITVYGDIGGMSGFVSVEQIQDGYAFGVMGINESGEEVLLDPDLN